jgi:isopentenyl-diphosphate delta-isomerase
MADIGARKSEHLDIVLTGDVQAHANGAGLDAVRFEHVAAPELDLDAIDLSAPLLGYRLRAPVLISSMTGGPDRAEAINQRLAEAASQLGIALAVGSQRIAVEGGARGGFTRALRASAFGVPLLANLGAAQIRSSAGCDLARAAVDMIEADALIIHLNPLQEAVQHGGDRDWTGVLAALERVVATVAVPVVVKEVGCGLSASLARRLHKCGIGILDVAGAGGTSWAAVEAARADTDRDREIAAAFRDWGIPTATAIREVRAACPSSIVIASGGLKTGLDVARSIRLGADICGFAAGLLAPALESTDALVTRLDIVIAQLKIACFCTGSANLTDLRSARLIGEPIPAAPVTDHIEHTAVLSPRPRASTALSRR